MKRKYKSLSRKEIINRARQYAIQDKIKVSIRSVSWTTYENANPIGDLLAYRDWHDNMPTNYGSGRFVPYNPELQRRSWYLFTTQQTNRNRGRGTGQKRRNRAGHGPARIGRFACRP